MNKGKRLKKNLKKKIWLDRESKPDLCDDRTQRATIEVTYYSFEEVTKKKQNKTKNDSFVYYIIYIR